MFYVGVIVTTILMSVDADLIKHDLSSQPKCKEVTRRAVFRRECGWETGLYRNLDHYYLNGRIIAYKIQWFNGSWSGWYVPGVNDIDGKVNVYRHSCRHFPWKLNSVRKIWSYFYDHTHKYILCVDRHWEKAEETRGRPSKCNLVVVYLYVARYRIKI